MKIQTLAAMVNAIDENRRVDVVLMNKLPERSADYDIEIVVNQGTSVGTLAELRRLIGNRVEVLFAEVFANGRAVFNPHQAY